MSLPIKIRRYESKDQKEVWDLHVQALQNVPGLDYAGGPWEDDLNHIEDTYIQTGGEFLVAEWNGRIVGMGALKLLSAARAEIKRMRVHPRYQHQGIGQNILTRLEHFAKQKGVGTLVLDTTIHQEPAQRLYLKNGYTELRREKRGVFDTIFYEKPLIR